MCGFAGFFSTSNFPRQAEVLLKSMGQAIVHRGPDDSGEWFDADAQIGFAHRRLSIVDLSSAGHQPMKSSSGRYVIAFNGEIYNHLSLREELSATGDLPHWCGHSDTETLLAGFDAWGIHSTIERSMGMFAFAVWDKHERTLTLGRDRIGEKPLYYGWQGDVFLFGSELKPLKLHPAFKGEINRGAISLLMRHNYIPAPYSIYQGINKLVPGCMLRISCAKPEPEIYPYWSATGSARAGINTPFVGSPEEAVDELERIAKDAVAQQMVADVPLGAFLSGGIDSSTIVALMQIQSSRPVKTFTIGFNEKGYNEAKHAKVVAEHLETDHTELYVRPEEAMGVVTHLPRLYDEPFSDSSQIPTFLVSQMTKQHVTVSLSGDGGDELFSGYGRYAQAASYWRKMAHLPLPLRRVAEKSITAFSPQVWNNLTRMLNPRSLKNDRPANWGDKIHKGAALLSSRSLDDLYLGLMSHHRDPSSLVIDGHEPASLLSDNKPNLTGLNGVQRMMALDIVTYLPDDILVKVDRAAMGVSLETRVPFLDHRIVEFAWTLPQSLKVHDGQGKWPLRQVLYRHVPRELIDRPKMGFGIPLHKWLRGPIKDWAEVLLDESRLRQEGIFHPQPIRRLWEEHQSGRRNWASILWNVLMFQAWLEAQKS